MNHAINYYAFRGLSWVELSSGVRGTCCTQKVNSGILRSVAVALVAAVVAVIPD